MRRPPLRLDQQIHPRLSSKNSPKYAKRFLNSKVALGSWVARWPRWLQPQPICLLAREPKLLQLASSSGNPLLHSSTRILSRHPSQTRSLHLGIPVLHRHPHENRRVHLWPLIGPRLEQDCHTLRVITTPLLTRRSHPPIPHLHRSIPS